MDIICFERILIANLAGRPMADITSLFSKRAFDSEMTRRLGQAYDCVLDALQDCGLPDIDEERVARHVISLAMQGERHVPRLCRETLKALAPSMSVLSRERREDIVYLRLAAKSVKRAVSRVHESIAVLNASVDLIAQVDQQLRAGLIFSSRHGVQHAISMET
jgi:hypothetical protein